MRMELGPRAFGHRVDDDFPGLTMGQGSGFPVAGRKQPLVFSEVRRGRGKPRQEVLDVGLQGLAEAPP
jgi:hypothetical protein